MTIAFTLHIALAAAEIRDDAQGVANHARRQIAQRGLGAPVEVGNHHAAHTRRLVRGSLRIRRTLGRGDGRHGTARRASRVPSHGCGTACPFSAERIRRDGPG